MKKLFAMLLVVTMMLTATFALAESVIMGTNAEFPPFEFIGDDGQPTGFEVELAYLLAEEMGLDLEIENMYFDGLLPALDVGTIDFLLSAMTITEERKQGALFSEPYFNATQAVIVMKGYDGIKALEDIADKKVAAQDGTTGFMMATDELGVNASNLFGFKASPDTVLELKAGRVDCIIIDDAVAQNFLKSNDDIEIVQGLDMPAEEYGIAVKLGNDELLASINAALETVKESGQYDELITKYFE